MDSMNDLLKLFMRQARQERGQPPPSAADIEVTSAQRQSRPKSTFSNDMALLAEVNDHDRV